MDGVSALGVRQWGSGNLGAMCLLENLGLTRAKRVCPGLWGLAWHAYVVLCLRPLVEDEGCSSFPNDVAGIFLSHEDGVRHLHTKTAYQETGRAGRAPGI